MQVSLSFASQYLNKMTCQSIFEHHKILIILKLIEFIN